MSTIDSCILLAENNIKMRKIGESLARSIYVRPVTILISGELGAGKTTFVQGLAKGLGITGSVVSPTFALEQRYGDVLCHLDLYRLTSPDQAHQILEHSHDFPGIRIIEWAERSTRHIDAGITIAIKEQEQSSRSITCTFSDIAIPSDEQINEWMEEMLLPHNVRLHCKAVTQVCDDLARKLIEDGRIIRQRALHAAALGHDLLRFINFNAPLPNEPAPTKDQTALWDTLKKSAPDRHEEAGAGFLSSHGFEAVGSIVKTHQGKSEEMDISTATIEQLILAYADKRILFDKPIGLNERFEYLKKRYGASKGIQTYDDRQAVMNTVERWLFPDGPPF